MMNRTHFYYLVGQVASHSGKSFCILLQRQIKATTSMLWPFCTHGTNKTQRAACKGNASVHGLHHCLWHDSLILSTLFPLKIPRFCVTAETSVSSVLWPCRENERLNCRVYLPPQLVSEQQESRPLLSPSIDDFLCETKCDGLSRPVTSNTAGTVQSRFPLSPRQETALVST